MTNLVKRKKPVDGVESRLVDAGVNQTNGKRKVEFADEVEEVGTGKRAKISGGGYDSKLFSH